MSNKNGFEFSLIVVSVDTVKAVQAGSGTDDDGKKFEYGSSVQFKCRNIDLEEDEILGLKEVETTLEIKVPCGSVSELSKLNKALLGVKVDSKSFPIATTLPRYNSNTRVFNCSATVSAAELLSVLSK